MKIGIIIQARTGSSRLPNKIFLQLPYCSGVSVLEQIVKRSFAVDGVDEIIIATTTGKRDDSVMKLSQKLNIKCFRGSDADVLSRYYWVAKRLFLDTVIRLTGDNPFIDPELVGSVLKSHIKRNNDYTMTIGYPLGMNVEVISFNSLKMAFEEASSGHDREHVTSYVYGNPDKFNIVKIKALKKHHAPDIRLTLDTEEDYALLCFIYDHFAKNNRFSISDLILLFKEKPWLKLINKKVIQKSR